jgi:hypothetical protein
VAVDGSLLARNGAVTLINDTVTRSPCAPGSGPTSGIGTAAGPISGGFKGPRVTMSGVPRARRGAFLAVCAQRDFTARFSVRDDAGIRRVKVYLDGKLIRRTTRTRFAVRLHVRRLPVNRHRLSVLARDRAGNASWTKRRFNRCATG